MPLSATAKPHLNYVRLNTTYIKKNDHQPLGFMQKTYLSACYHYNNQSKTALGISGKAIIIGIATNMTVTMWQPKNIEISNILVNDRVKNREKQAGKTY